MFYYTLNESKNGHENEWNWRFISKRVKKKKKISKQHKARELYMVTLRNHAPRSYMKWSPVTLNVLDMIIV